MYEDFYHLKEKPFSLTPDPKFLYLSKQHQGALDHMLYGIKQREGFMTIVGDVGTGKTTLCRCLLDRLEKNVEVALILNPMLSDMDLLRTCIHDLRVQPAAVPRESLVAVTSLDEPHAMSSGSDLEEVEVEVEVEPDPDWIHKATKKELIDALNTFLLAQHASGGSTVLIIDEAQNLSLDVMEQLRILSNLETEKEKLMQIIFVGQLELNEKLKLPELKQLNQRISIRYEITPLSSEETRNYIGHRILVAGAGSRVMFTRSAYNEIFEYSKGYPRLINLVCDRALLAGYNSQTDMIERSHVRQGIRSLLGEEEKDYFLFQFLRVRLPLVASVLFFVSGMIFYLLPQFGVEINSGFRKNLAGLISETNSVKASLVSESSQPVSAGKSEVESPPSDVGNTVSVKKASLVEPESGEIAEEPVPAVDEEGAKYRIQVYSLGSRERVEEEVAKLQAEGFQAYWKNALSGDQGWYIVYVGPFNEENTARIHLDALKFSGRKPILLSVSKSG